MLVDPVDSLPLNLHVIHTERPHFGGHSGIEQFLKYLNPMRHHVSVHVASDSDADFHFGGRRLRKLLRRGVQLGGMEYYKLSDLVAEFNAWRKCRTSKVDVVHFVDGEHSAQYLPWLLRDHCKTATKTLATFHQPPERLKKLTRAKVIERLDHVTVVSPLQLPFFHKLLEPKRVSLILHGIDVDYFRPGNATPDEKRFRCLTVGHWLRDFGALRDVASRLRSRADIEFHVVVSRRIMARIPELEGVGNLVFHGSHLDDAALLKLYQDCQLLFLPLIDATANNALLEGMACGLPVLSTDLPSVKSYVPANVAVLVGGNRAQDFADAILHLQSRSDLRREMGRNARAAAERLDWRNIALQYETTYAQLLNNDC